MSETNHSLAITGEQAAHIFGSDQEIGRLTASQSPIETVVGVTVAFTDSRLGLIQDAKDPDVYHVTGNTVPRLCGAMGNCAANMCGLADESMSLWDRRDRDCAMSNAAETFGGRVGYMLLQTNNDVVFMEDPEALTTIQVKDEQSETVDLMKKAKAGAIFVISERDVRGLPDRELFVGANNADNSFIVAGAEIAGQRYALVASSTRLNLGERGPDAQIFRKAIDGILDRRGLEGNARQKALERAVIDIQIGYSAGLENFKHDVRLPAEGSDDANKLIAANGLKSYAELTPTIVMSGKEGQYPTALENGEVYGAFEAENGVDVPRGPGGCPGFGEYCYIHYPKITRRTIVDQLKDMGLSPDNIRYDASHSIDPAAVDNRLASNRRMQLAGVPVKETLRSVNGAVIKFPRRPWRIFRRLLNAS